MASQGDEAVPQAGTPEIGSGSAGEVVARGWLAFTSLPSSARDSIWDLFAITLLAPNHPQTEPVIAEFCKRHEVDRDQALEAIRGCDFMFRSAAAMDATREAFEQDLKGLSPSDDAAVAVLMSQFEPVKTQLRKEIVQNTLADHGKVLLGIDWRVDSVSTSDRGVDLGATVVMLTLRYRDGERSERMTLQLTPESIGHLRAFTERFSS